MGEHIVDDPVLVDTFKADDRGRVRLGKEYSEKNIKLVVEEVQ